MTAKMKMLMVAGVLAIAAGTAPVQARSLTSDPDATMHEQQKLGPNAVTTQLSNGFVTQRIGPLHGPIYGPAYGYSYGHAPSYGYAPGYGMTVEPGW